jgi:hypothetical protein
MPTPVLAPKDNPAGSAPCEIAHWKGPFRRSPGSRRNKHLTIACPDRIARHSHIGWNRACDRERKMLSGGSPD